MPFMVEPIACSRTPKWILRFWYEPAWKSADALMTVLFDGERSAEPPIICGIVPAIALMTSPL
jgi:hypothetical protein